MPGIEVLGRYADDIGAWDAASQGAVTRQGIEKRPLLRPGEVLEAVPGMVVTQHSGDGKANQYFLRGYNLDHGTDFATWVAGMPVNMPTHAHGQGYTDLNFLIPELIERVVYTKGPYFAEDGDFSSVGTARISYAEQLREDSATLTAGSFDFQRAVVTGSPALGPGHLVYGVEYQHNDGSWDLPANYRKANAVLRYASGTADNGFNVTAMGYSAKWDSTDQIPQRAVDAGTVGRYGYVDPTDGGKAQRYSLSGEWRAATDTTTTTFAAYAIRSRLNLFSNFTYFLDDPDRGDQFEQAERRTTLGGQGSRTWTGVWSARPYWNTVGLQVRHDRLEPVGLYASEGRERLATTREDQVTVQSAAPFVSNTLLWTPWLRTLAALRYDAYRFKVSSDLRQNSGDRSDSIVSPKLSVVLGPWADTELFVNGGSGFHSNDARGTTTRVDPKTGEAAEPVDPLVRTRGHELGARSKLAQGLTASMSLWALRQDSELLFVGDAGTTEPSRPSKRKGVELLVQYLPLPWIAMDLAYARTKARFDGGEGGNLIPGAPETVAAAGIALDHPSGVSAALRWRYFGPRPLVEDGSVTSRSTSMVNARLGYVVSKAMHVHLDVFNLFDRKDDDIAYFYASRLPGEPAAGVDDVHFHPVERRAARVSVSLAF
ncbi:Vitamin B12 transporter BtuB [Usitatibacter rugosus]|uniref:Vitamin B12 transporter BtuB n=2 Tax=Usitatibacter rugosus TaxID=2732067 RepID=A0A6M4GWW7_9PROT|nr:Vitamin B12 transporter BtuB [Usitatibacter rugosus]